MPYIGNPAVIGDSTNTFRSLDNISSFTLTFDAASTDIVSVANDTLTFSNHRFVTGQRVVYTDGGGTVITGLADGTAYFIIKVDQNTIKLATSASNSATGTAINLTGVGSGGSHTLTVSFDGVNTKFKATHNNGTKAKVSRPQQLTLSVNGVVQQPEAAYGIEADSTIVFNTAPVATDKVFASFIGEVAGSFDISDNTIDNLTGDGTTVSFTLTKTPPSADDVLVTIDGVTQYPSTSASSKSYTVLENTIVFTSAPANGAEIQVRHIGFAGASSADVTAFYGRTGNVILTNTDDVSVSNVSAGIITATGGIDAIGIQSGGLNVTVGLITALNFVGAGNTFLYNSSTKTVDITIEGSGAVGTGTDKIFYESDQTVTQSYSISAGKNAMVAGPLAVASGQTITIPSGSELTIV